MSRFAHGADGETAEDEGRNGVKRVVAVQEALNRRHEGRGVGSGRRLGFAHRSEAALHDEDRERKDEKRGQNLAHTVDKLRRRRGKPTRNDEENGEEDGHADFELRGIEEGRDADFPGNGAGSGYGKAGTDGENADVGIKGTEPGVHAAADFLQPRQTRVADRHERKERESDAGNAKAQNRPPDFRAGGLAHGGGENQIARAEKEREEHETDGDESCFRGGLHGCTFCFAVFLLTSRNGSRSTRADSILSVYIKVLPEISNKCRNFV